MKELIWKGFRDLARFFSFPTFNKYTQLTKLRNGRFKRKKKKEIKISSWYLL